MAAHDIPPLPMLPFDSQGGASRCDPAHGAAPIGAAGIAGLQLQARRRNQASGWCCSNGNCGQLQLQGQTLDKLKGQ